MAGIDNVNLDSPGWVLTGAHTVNGRIVPGKISFLRLRSNNIRPTRAASTANVPITVPAISPELKPLVDKAFVEAVGDEVSVAALSEALAECVGTGVKIVEESTRVDEHWLKVLLLWTMLSFVNKSRTQVLQNR